MSKFNTTRVSQLQIPYTNLHKNDLVGLKSGLTSAADEYGIDDLWTVLWEKHENVYMFLPKGQTCYGKFSCLCYTFSKQ